MTEARLTPPTPIRPIEGPPDASGRSELNLSPNFALSDQILETVSGDRADLVGLEFGFEYRDTDRSADRDYDKGKRYSVIDSRFSLNIDRLAKEKVGLPRIVNDGSSIKIVRPEIETTVKRVGLPRYVKRGSHRSFERKEVPLNGTITCTPMVTAAVYETGTGDLVDIKEVSQDDLLDIADNLGDGKPIVGVGAAWSPKPEVSTREEGVPIELTGEKSYIYSKDYGLNVFDELTEKLEALDATSWQGVSWQRGTITEEIVSDEAIKRRAFDAADIWVRTFAIKKTSEGVSMASLELKNAIELAEYLETFGPHADTENDDEASYITDIRLNKPAVQEMEAVGDDPKRYIGRLALPKNIHDDGPESLIEEDERGAAWLLSYPDILQDDDRLTIITDILDSTQGKKRIKTLSKAIEDYGVEALGNTAQHLMDKYKESMKKLDHQPSVFDLSMTRVFESMADMSIADISHIYEASHDHHEAETVQRNIVDNLIGRSFANVVTEADGPEANESALIRVQEVMAPANGLNAQGQPYYKIKGKLVFDDGFLEVHDPPPVSKPQMKIYKARKDLRRRAQEQAETIFKKIEEGKSPTLADHTHLGRYLRRLIGE